MAIIISILVGITSAVIGLNVGTTGSQRLAIIVLMVSAYSIGLANGMLNF